MRDEEGAKLVMGKVSQGESESGGGWEFGDVRGVKEGRRKGNGVVRERGRVCMFEGNDEW